MSGRTLIGLIVLATARLSCSETSPVDGTVEGNWGGEGIQIEVYDGRTLFYLTCADGAVDAIIAFDREGSFAATGTIAIGPVVSETVVARYTGRVVGDSLTVTITLVESGTALGTFTAERDRNVQLVQCR